MRKLGLYFTAVLPFFAAILIQYIVINILAFVYRFYVGFRVGVNQSADGVAGEGITQAVDLAMSQETLFLLSVLGVIACGVVFFFWFRFETIGEIRGSYKEVLTLKYISLFAVLGIGCQLFFSGVMIFLTPFFVEIFTDYSEVLQTLTSGNSFVVLIMSLIAPITEELIFRGVILHMANRYVSFLGANILQAILFGIYHENVVQGVYAALLGFLLGMMYRKFKSIFAPILLHTFINMSSFLLYLFPENTSSYLVIVAAGMISITIALHFIKPFRTFND